jgi:hypothetical protein
MGTFAYPFHPGVEAVALNVCGVPRMTLAGVIVSDAVGLRGVTANLKKPWLIWLRGGVISVPSELVRISSWLSPDVTLKCIIETKPPGYGGVYGGENDAILNPTFTKAPDPVTYGPVLSSSPTA